MMRTVAFALAAGLALAGCGGSGDTAWDIDGAALSGGDTKVYEMACEVDDSFEGATIRRDLVRFATFRGKYEQAWAVDSDNCTAEMVGTTAGSERQRAAVKVAYGSDDVMRAGTLHGMCAEARPPVADAVATEAVAREAAGMLILCPEHPKADAIRANVRAVLG